MSSRVPEEYMSMYKTPPLGHQIESFRFQLKFHEERGQDVTAFRAQLELLIEAYKHHKKILKDTTELFEASLPSIGQIMIEEFRAEKARLAVERGETE